MQNHETEKKGYTEPTLITHGNVRDVTQQIAPPHDGSGPPRIFTS